MLKKLCMVCISCLVLASPVFAKDKLYLSAQKAALPTTTTSQFTLGLVQTSIKTGMSQADVISALGAPNIATRDAEGKDSWVYDKIYTESSSLNHDAGASVILVGWGRNSNRSVQVQKTITVIIKFDKNQQVDTYTYHNSQF